ncbi:MAG: hypothetical protein ACQEV6_07740 [Pseudomonadota bacterium]
MIARGLLKIAGRALPFTALALSTSLAIASPRDDFPSCYSVLGNEAPESQAPARELFVIVDQTLTLNVDLKRHAHEKIHEYLTPGDRFTLLTFSAYAQGRYASMPLTGKIDHRLSDDQRYVIGSTKLRAFDSCMAKQKTFVRKRIDASVKEAFEQASTGLPKTELMGSLANFGNGIISQSDARQKVILIVSDMMENSEAISFYGRGGIKNLDIQSSLEKVRKHGLLSNLEGANVNIVGAGISGNDGYLSQSTMRKMKDFWAAYFEQSGARLTGWGQPELFGGLL